MDWKSLAVRTDSGHLRGLEDLFWRTGAVSVTLVDAQDNPIFEPGPGEIPVWDKVTATGLYEEKIDVEVIRQSMKEAGFELLYVESLGDRVWEREWLTRFKPMQFGQRLWVCPTGHKVSESGAVVMGLDPGLAFGTGTHATTKMCLEWLDRSIKPGMKVVDFGSGSGILGIASLLLGASSVVAVDNDPQALVASRDNAKRNAVDSRLQVCLPSDIKPEKFDVVVANILAQPLIDLAGQLIDMMKPQANLLLSGIMESQSNSVKQAYPLQFVGEEIDDGWVCLHARKN
ncbi:MAG: 50S ribosomal protein L11 methyltransferase [bacterium]|nr:50S ribosomal protein L11 methyltransferase [Gammaproteobacteria bacterium]HIL95478.1 50S ribosomal protein L11 methyltransferase [Pseudomonadales bacterium]